MRILFIGGTAVLAAAMGCSATPAPEPLGHHQSNMNLDGTQPSGNIADRRDEPPDTPHDPEPAPDGDPVDTSPGSLSDQAGINGIGKSPAPGNSPQDGDGSESGQGDGTPANGNTNEQTGETAGDDDDFGDDDFGGGGGGGGINLGGLFGGGGGGGGGGGSGSCQDMFGSAATQNAANACRPTSSQVLPCAWAGGGSCTVSGISACCF